MHKETLDEIIKQYEENKRIPRIPVGQSMVRSSETNDGQQPNSLPQSRMATENWTIRKAIPTDAKALNECMKAAYMSYTGIFADDPLPPMTADYGEEIRLYPVWVAESDGVLVGGLILIPEQEHMTIANVAVHPRYQGKGLGRGLMTYAEVEARRQGYTKLRLATHTILTENISLYSHLGWSEVDRDESRVFMEKNIVV